ncbi:ABC transporter substrate-binding protein [Pontibacter sp. E15-1]|uniref:ABC transporter substrate-binding protein n=1 Tax=Pontibacter sp. E15-1 TaxID=2919918 RepID=UPI001F4F281A|nr:ABC transporter substrate-binding protein [Pontibacter sp. E15-1]MCJ8167432.1 ABC transporter substrate-binding protein [Pontibacter sp. E15-1]
MRVRLAVDPETLSPVSYSDVGALQIVNLLFQSLLVADLADNQVKPCLAAAMPQVERQDSVTLFTYQIREEASWADGSPVTAADVAFTLKVLKAPLLNNEFLKPQVQFIQDIRVDVTAPKRFTLVCKGYAPEMELLTGDFFILPAHLFDPDALLLPIEVAALNESFSELENNGNLIAFADRFNSQEYGHSTQMLQGSGGYVLERWESGRYLTLKRKSNWWGNELPDAPYVAVHPERISFQVIPDNTTAILALRSRQLDVLGDIAATEFDRMRQDSAFKKDYALFAPDTYEFIYAGINSRHAKFADKRTRQAIVHLLDIENIIAASQQSYATPTVGPVPPTLTAYYNDQLRPYTYNVEKAKALLAAAGWEQEQDGWVQIINGSREQLTIEINYRAGNSSYENAALIFQQSAAELGIPVQLQAMENSLLSQKLKAHTYDMFFRSISGNPFVLNFRPLLHTSHAETGGMNVSGFGTEESDNILDAINKATTPEVKAKLLKRLQEILHEEAAFVSLFYLKDRLAVHKRFGNLKISGLKPNYDVSAFTLKE